MCLLNAGCPLRFALGDTALGVEIDEPNWTGDGAAAVVRVQGRYDGVDASPFDGQAATIAQASGPMQIRYAWPSALPAGQYRVWFTVTFSDGKVLSTEAVIVIVEDE